ncbi:hypothetical protein QUF72_12230, partial [Desulfobacterales bacterium HSG2]|nr:hypothetical protein [Desulfobacterales bacterium HSG2]
DTYRTSDGMACFDFCFHFRNARYEVEVVSVPANGNRAILNMEGRRISSGNNPVVKTYSQAKKLGKVWAEYTWCHIKKECCGDRV